MLVEISCVIKYWNGVHSKYKLVEYVRDICS